MEIGGRSFSHNSKDSSSVEMSALCKLFRASQDTYSSILGSYDYISPVSFFYLIDRLLLLSSFTLDFFFTVKSSFVEWIVCGDSRLNDISSFGGDNHLLKRDIFYFLATVTEQLLIGSINMSEWAKNSGLSESYGCQTLLLRVILTLCFVCVNCGTYFDILSRVLRNNYINSLLPTELIWILMRLGERNHLITNSDILTEALTLYMDPLVLVSTCSNQAKLNCPEVIFVDMNSTSCKEDILRILYPVQSTVSPEQAGEVEATKLYSDNPNGQFSDDSSSNLAAQKMRSENIKRAKLKTSSYCGDKLPKGFPLSTKKGREKIKEWFGRLEALDPDEQKRLSFALDRRDLDESVAIMWHTMRKQVQLTGDPSIDGFLRKFQREEIGDKSTFDEYGDQSRNWRPTSNFGSSNFFSNTSRPETENKNKGKRKVKKGNNEKADQKK